MDASAALDRLPRLTVDVGHRRLPAFRSLGIIGFQLGVVVAVLVALLSGLPVVTAVGVAAVAGLSFFGWGLLRRALTGGETLVLVEYVWVALGAVVAFLWVSGAPLTAGLDVMAVALCPFLAFGRLGCTAVGCCHGVPVSAESRWSVRYGPEHGLPARITGRPLLPVALLEASGLTLIGVVGLGLVAGSAPGTATVWFLLAYAVLRFGLEALRGDRRPVLLGLSVARLTCVAQLLAGLWLAQGWLPAAPAEGVSATGVVLAVVGVGGVLLSRVRSGGPLVTPDHLDEAWTLLTELRSRRDTGSPRMGVTSSGLSVAVTDEGGVVHVSVAHPTSDPFGVALALGAGLPEVEVARGTSAVHLRWADRDRVTARAPFGADCAGAAYFARPAAAAPGW